MWVFVRCCSTAKQRRSEEHTSELQSQQPISYAVFCLKKNYGILRQKELISGTRSEKVGPAEGAEGDRSALGEFDGVPDEVFFKQKTAYGIGCCDWSSDVCSSDLWCVRTYVRGARCVCRDRKNVV